jgi:hypothetical protein
MSDEEYVEEGDYRRVDRRRAADEADAASPEPETEPMADAEPDAAEGQRPMTLVDLPVPDVLRFCYGLFVELAWVHLGIQKAPAADDVRTDLSGAKAAIEAVRALGAQLEPYADEAERKEIQQVLANLQINFVRRSSS